MYIGDEMILRITVPICVCILVAAYLIMSKMK